MIFGSSLRLGCISGVVVRLNWSVLVVAWLLWWGLATQLFPEAHPGGTPAAYWLAGATGVVLFFASLLAHELAHARVARRYDVDVQEITLWMLGGMAKLERDAPTPEAEMRIAAVGPLVSGLLGVGFLTLGAILAPLAPPLASAVTAWLGSINLLLAAFNIIPAFPMDGGRVLRAWLWRRHGDRLRATETASTAGRWFGWTLIAGGVLIVSSGAGIGGLWLCLIGLFLVTVASAERSAVYQQEALRDVMVADVMTSDPLTVSADITVADVIEHHVLTEHVSSYPVMKGRHPIGLVTLSRLRGTPRHRRAEIPVEDVAWPLADVPIAAPDQPLLQLLPTLGIFAGGRALVMDGETLVGIVSQTDVARVLDIQQLRNGFAA